MKTLEYFISIVPDKIMYEDRIFAIRAIVDLDFIIENLKIVLGDDDMVEHVYIGKKHHPNAIDDNDVVRPPFPASEKTEWCVPNFIKQKKFNTEILDEIVKRIKIWNYNSCYWKTWDNRIVDFHEIKKSENYTKIPPRVKKELFSDSPRNSFSVLYHNMLDFFSKKGDMWFEKLRKMNTKL